MRKVFKPTRENLPPRVVRTLDRRRIWHSKNGYRRFTLEQVLRHATAIRAGSFLLLIEDGSKKYNGNAAISVFNHKGQLIEDRAWFNPVPGRKIPRKAFMGTPIVDGSKPMQFKPLRKKDSAFHPV